MTAIPALLDYGSLAMMISGGTIISFMLVHRRLHRALPVFTAYIFYQLFTTICLRVIEFTTSDSIYWMAFLAQNAIQRIVEIALIWELATTLRDAAPADMKRQLILISWLNCAACVGCGLILGHIVQYYKVDASTQLFLHLDFSAGVIESLLFIALGIGTRVLRLHRKNAVVLIVVIMMLYSIGWVGTRIFQEFGQKPRSALEAFLAGDQIASFLWCFALWALAIGLWRIDPTYRSSGRASQSKGLAVDKIL